MFDPELQLRFVRSSTNAFVEFGRATMAAANAWQREVANPPAPAPAPSAAYFDIWTGAWKWWLEAAATPVPDFWRNSRAAESMPMAWPWLLGWPTPPNSAATPFMFASPFNAFGWPMRMMPWSFYQGPMMGMMLSAGMPYAVAAPAARASTSAMEAAEAAQQQLQLIFSSYRNDSGYATAAL